MKNKKYTMGVVKINGYNLYTIWNEETGEPLKDFYAFELGRKAKSQAIKYLKNLKNG